MAGTGRSPPRTSHANTHPARYHQDHGTYSAVLHDTEGTFVSPNLFFSEYLGDVRLNLFTAKFLDSSREGGIGLDMGLVGVDSAQLQEMPPFAFE